ncbi:MAG: c-type cytochrome [Woeseia sp.]
MITAAGFALGACSPGEQDAAADRSEPPAALTAATLGEQSILSAEDYLADTAYLHADVRRGEALAMQCRACHSLERGGASIVGPNLFGIFGRPAGSADFAYSDALAGSDFVWTPRALDAWLVQPFAFLPGNRMSFPGLPADDDRNSLIAYLLHTTDSGADE